MNQLHPTKILEKKFTILILSGLKFQLPQWHWRKISCHSKQMIFNGIFFFFSFFQFFYLTDFLMFFLPLRTKMIIRWLHRCRPTVEEGILTEVDSLVLFLEPTSPMLSSQVLSFYITVTFLISKIYNIWIHIENS